MIAANEEEKEEDTLIPMQPHGILEIDDNAMPQEGTTRGFLTRAAVTPTPNTPDEKGMDLEKTTKGEKNGVDDDERFSLAENKLDTSFCGNFRAVFLKRWNSYRRSIRRVLTEIFLPSAFMVFGVYVGSMDFSRQSDSRLYVPSLYPLK